jgi:hypothetical protein
LDVVRDVAVKVAKQRVKLCSQNCNIKAIRIANGDEPERVGRTYSDEVLVGTQPEAGMASNVAVNCQFGTEDNRKQKLVQLRGCPDSWESNGGQLLVDLQPLKTAFASWRAMLIDQKFGWRGITSRVPFVVSNYTVTGAGTVTVTVAPPNEQVSLLTAIGPVGTRKTVLFKRVNGRSILNGSQVAIVLSATTLQLVYPLALIPFQSAGIVEVPTMGIHLVANGTVQRLGKRQAGAPLLQSVGRRSARPRI